jgi:hypothetical protein
MEYVSIRNEREVGRILKRRLTLFVIVTGRRA